MLWVCPQLLHKSLRTTADERDSHMPTHCCTPSHTVTTARCPLICGVPDRRPVPIPASDATIRSWADGRLQSLPGKASDCQQYLKSKCLHAKKAPHSLTCRTQYKCSQACVAWCSDNQCSCITQLCMCSCCMRVCLEVLVS